MEVRTPREVRAPREVGHPGRLGHPCMEVRTLLYGG